MIRLQVRFAWLIYVFYGAPLSITLADTPVVGLQKRVPWTTSRIKGSPDPPLPYLTERAFPALNFDRCLDITHPPGSERLYVVEQAGRIFSFPCRQDVDTADLVVDLAKEIEGVEQVYALTFHPEFSQNRYCYVCYIKTAGREDGTHVARFRVAETDPPTIDVHSETTIITWLSGGHNGCCLKFGPDGYLYISTGDGVGPNPPDTKQTGQDISDLLSSILRIDVDSASEANADDGDKQNYRIPPDNPFVGMANARGEIWAYGFRNPWRMSFDRQTGDLWVGDVGWELWELLDRVQRGGNYGWSVMEGRQPTNPEWPRGPTPILPPTIDHPHSESSSITDGLTYYGNRLKELAGRHIYGDYDTGKIWGFRYEDGRVVDHRELADTTHRIVGFGEDHQGELYLLDHTAGTVHRLVPNPQRDQPGDFPRKLSESGLFSDVADLVPAPGVVAYSINAEPWADHATAERLVAVPGDAAIQAAEARYTFPQDSVLVKTISLEMKQGNASSRRRIETQILHFDGSEWQPYTYQWNDDQTDAILLGAGGGEVTFEITDSGAADGKRHQTWRFAGRAECQRCHNKWSGPALAFNTPQLNREQDYGGVVANQLEVLAQVGLMENLPAADRRPRLADPHDPAADLDGRARAYLQVNCAHCHRMHAGSSVLSKMHYDLPLEKTDMVGVRPTQGTFGIHAAEVIAAGDPFRSVLLYRMSKLGGGRMPIIGSTEVDRHGVRFISEWIRQMASERTQGVDYGAESTVAKLREEKTATLDELRTNSASSTRQSELVGRMLSSTSGAMMLLQSLEDGSLSPHTTALVVDTATSHQEVCIRDLFERFLPAAKRSKRLGNVVQKDQVLSLAGDFDRGKRLFFATSGVQCKNCHRIQNDGQQLGPELTKIGQKYDRAQLLESILEPSKIIDPKYVTYLAETQDGRLLTGLLVKKDGQEVVLKDAQNNLIRLAAKHVERLVPQQLSLMPELLLRDMTAQQVADLLTYLCALK